MVYISSNLDGFLYCTHGYLSNLQPIPVPTHTLVAGHMLVQVRVQVDKLYLWVTCVNHYHYVQQGQSVHQGT